MDNKKGYIEPVKFDAFFTMFERVLAENQTIETKDGKRQIPNNNAIIFTDMELVEETNDRLPKNQRITKRTFEGWKKAFNDETLSPEIMERFFRVYKTAIRKSKEKLFNALVIDHNGWQRFAWIMERKFSETWGKKEIAEEEKPQQIQIVKNYQKKIE